MQISIFERRWLMMTGFLALVVGVLALTWSAQGAAKTMTSRPGPGVCQSAFPAAKTTRLGRTLFYNRQSSVQTVDCYEFGLKPSADFPMTAGVACGVLSSVLGGFTKTEKFALFADGSCSGAALAGEPKSPERYVATACSWASDLLGVVSAKIGGFLGNLACALAPSAGSSLGARLESKHEFGVAKDIAQHGKCLKYSPSHFGSPWLAVACARSDKGFSTLPLGYASTRACGIPGGLIDDNSLYKLDGAVTVTMPYQTASMIAHKIGPGEFGKPTTANDIPCNVGQFVAQQALNAGAVGSHTANVDGEWTGEAGGYDLGTFVCTPTGTYPWNVTCVHAASAAAAQVIVRFEASSDVD